MKRKGLLTLVGGICLTLVLAALLLPSCAAEEAPAPTPEVPRLMTWSAYDVGSSGYMMLGFVAEAIMDKYGTKIRIIPAGTDLPRHLPLRAGDVDASITGFGVVAMQEGIDEYKTLDWGPQTVRVMRFMQQSGIALIVRADSDIHTPADLRGKKVAFYPGSAILTKIVEWNLAFAGLTWDDVEVVDVPGYSGAGRMVMEGKIDTAIVVPTAALCYEFEAMPYGLRYLPTPHADTAGWERARQVEPAFVPRVADIGAGLSPEKPLETGTYAYPIAVVYDWTDEDMVYFMTKAIHETYDMYLPKHEAMGFWSIEGHWNLFNGTPLPLHKGAIRYYDELGMWTPELEALNQERIENQAALKALWDTVVEEALAKEIKSSEFPEFWLEKRAAAGF